MDQEPKKKSENWGCAIIVFLVMFPMLYVLSIGPAAMIVNKYPKVISSKTAETFYFPVIWLHKHTILKEPIEVYVRLWIRD
jgi:hypothetical protein